MIIQFENRCLQEAETVRNTFEDNGHEKRLYLTMVTTFTYEGVDYMLGSDCLYKQKIMPLGRELNLIEEETAGRIADQVC